MRKVLHCQVELVLSSGEELSGVFCHGRRSGRCTVRSPAKGIRCGGKLYQSYTKVIPKLYQSYTKVPLRRELSGVWRQDVLGGVVRCVYTDGGVAEGQVVQGAWHCTVLHTVLYCTGGAGGGTVLCTVLYTVLYRWCRGRGTARTGPGALTAASPCTAGQQKYRASN